MALLLHDVYAGDGTLHHDIIILNFTWNDLIIIYIYYYHTNIMQISIYVINYTPEPGRNLAADACMERTQLSPCIYNFSTRTIRASRNAMSAWYFFSCWATCIQIFFGNIHNIVTTTVTNSTGVEPVSFIYIVKPTGCQNNPGRVFPLDASASIPVLVISIKKHLNDSYQHLTSYSLRHWPVSICIRQSRVLLTYSRLMFHLLTLTCIQQDVIDDNDELQ